MSVTDCHTFVMKFGWPSRVFNGTVRHAIKARTDLISQMKQHAKSNTCVPDLTHVPREKFTDPVWTAKGERRATVPFNGLTTLWFNTGTLCNITCQGCYIESSPKNDALIYISRSDVATFLAEAVNAPVRPREIGFTGGEPFMNPDFLGMLEDSLALGFDVLVLTNAMKPMQQRKDGLLALHQRFPGQLTVRVSLDHHTRARHEEIRGKGTWTPALDGVRWLAENGFNLAIAGRKLWAEPEAALRAGYTAALAENGITLDGHNPARLVLFPEMDAQAEIPEISVGCWKILNKQPDEVMCASSRMVIKRKGATAPVVVSCTLLPYHAEFEMGTTLAAASKPVALNHRHCAKFCVLGGASCSA
jgi:Radical SAM superfamily/4Fe-4S single cluster domain